MVMVTDLFWAWLAGFVDGEGSISVFCPPVQRGKRKTCHKLRLRIALTHFPTMQRLHILMKAYTGGGSLSVLKDSRSRNNTAYGWQLVGKQAQWVIFKISPFLTVKREHAHWALLYPTGNRTGVRGLEPSKLRVRWECWANLRSLNSKRERRSA